MQSSNRPAWQSHGVALGLGGGWTVQRGTLDVPCGDCTRRMPARCLIAPNGRHAWLQSLRLTAHARALIHELN